MYAHAAVLEALIERGVTGRGKGLSTSLFAAIADWMTVPLLYTEASGAEPARMGLAHPTVCPYGAFPLRDGTLVLISVQNEREWAQFCSVFMGDPDLANRPGLEFECGSGRQPSGGGLPDRPPLRVTRSRWRGSASARGEHGVWVRE